MLTKNEVNALNLSPTKKDFVQIWNELLDVAGKLSERWDPTSTNESDPGIVILKALTGIADKLNYNIDKNTLEAFMPTAAQEDSMRKLCEMLGYSVKYYQSAKTSVTFKYHGTDPTDAEVAALNGGLVIPKFTTVTNSDKTTWYFTTDHRPIVISSLQPNAVIECMQGQVVKCESINDNDIISANQISENNRFYLPETYIAENGIFIYNIYYGVDGVCDDGERWTKVDNLNTQARGNKVFKFGYDSYASRPYIEFPEDYSSLFKDGIFIYYTRTKGADGNIAPHELTQLELPSLPGWDQVAAESFSVDNLGAATTGSNVETIKQAYKNFKKTIGTFDTLVTCRDYMNKIYSMIDYCGKPLVSNVLVTDLRNDLNRAITICSCDNTGILYKEKPITKPVDKKINIPGDQIISYPTKPVYVESSVQGLSGSWYMGDQYGLPLQTRSFLQEQEHKNNFNLSAPGEVIAGDDYWIIKQQRKSGGETITEEFLTNLKCKSTQNSVVAEYPIVEHQPEINHFDLVLYPFKTYKQIKSNSNTTNIRAVYDDSFNLTNLATVKSIKQQLNDSDIKTIAHNIITPRTAVEKAADKSVEDKVEDEFKGATVGDIISINNYLRLNATIATTVRLTDNESKNIIYNIKVALANAFNMRELDFGEEIPFDSIMEVIETADPRIKIVSLNEPVLYTTFSVLDHFNKMGVPQIIEYGVKSKWTSEETAETIGRFGKKSDSKYSFDTVSAREIYNRLAVRNILAGRVPLFNYSSSFNSDFYEAPYYQAAERTTLGESPLGLTRQYASNNYCIWMDEQGDIYTRQKTATGESIYSKLHAPYLATGNNPALTLPEGSGPISGETAPNNGSNSSDTPDVDNSTTGAVSNVIAEDANGGDITDIQAYNNIFADNNGSIMDLTLSDGEFVKLRAPNFRTKATYPAYINYHLKLNQELTTNGEAKLASANTLFEVLNASSDADTKRQKVLDYFRTVDANTNTSYLKKFTISQKISKFSQASATDEDVCTGVNNAGKPHVRDETTGECKYCDKPMFSVVQKGPIKVSIKEEQDAKIDEVDTLLNKSGFIKLLNTNFKANLAWDTSDGDQAPKGKVPLEIQLDFENNNSSPFITDPSIIAKIQAAVTSVIEQSRNKVKSDRDPTPILPTACAWTVSFDFECVPFEPASLQEWEKFVRFATTTGKSAKDRLVSYKPVEENSVIFWRTYGQGYAPGKYILPNREKLLKFDRNYFNSLSANNTESILHKVYLVESLGADEKPNLIANNKEYQLKDNEYLYIEYTSSSTTEDSSQQSNQKKEILGPGTIVKPSGFESGLMDSDAYSRLGNTAYKTVTFEQNGKTEDIPMFRFASNEQLEVRELSKVELSQETLVGATSAPGTSRTIHVYKNFNDCPELESILDTLTEKPVKGPRKYTLKDGEYIFYTDNYKSEFAYYGSGTEVTLEGDTKIPKCDNIDIATIFDSSISEIPWQSVILDSADKIIFQEFQYVTLGPKDTIKNITLTDAKTTTTDGLMVLDDNWTYCINNIEYQLQGANEPTILPEIAVERPGNGWEVCSLLELASSPTNAQTLRYIKDVIDTGLVLLSADSGGDGSIKTILSPKYYAGTSSSSALTFKTNLPCNIGTNHVNIQDLFTNLNNTKSFKLKVFTADAPTIVETQPNKVVPVSPQTALMDWTGESIGHKDFLDTWYQVNMDKIKINNVNEDLKYTYDNALALPVLITPNTYGIASFYVEYTSSEATNSVWIEVIPGTSKNDITILNASSDRWGTAPLRSGDSDKLFLNPGINCIRFNKSGKFFVKAAKETQGMLYFDELRLVECDTLCYKNSEGKEKKILTNGLNLKQLGYLDTSPNSTPLIDQETLERLSNSLYSDFTTDTSNIATVAQRELIQDSVPFINALSTINKVREDLDNIIAIDPSSIANSSYDMLISTYKNLSSALALESELLETINNNEADEQLLAYLNQLAPKEITQEQCSQALEYIKLLIEENIKARTADQTLVSFKQNYTTPGALQNDAKSALTETKKVLLQQTNEKFMKDLDDFVKDLEVIINNNELAEIRSALEALQETLINEKNSEIHTLLNELIASVSLDSIYSLFTELDEALASENFVELKKLLNNLSNMILTKETQVIMADLSEAINAKNIKAAKQLLKTLSELGDEESFIASIKEAIEGAIGQVNAAREAQKAIETARAELAAEQAKSEPTTEAEKQDRDLRIRDLTKALTDAQTNLKTIINNDDNVSVSSTLTEVKDKIETGYAQRVTNLVKEITDKLDATLIDDEVTKLQEFINSLVVEDDNKILELLDQINASKAQYDQYKAALKLLDTSITWGSLEGAIYAKDFKTEIAYIWPSYLLEAVKRELSGIETDIAEAIAGEELSIALNKNFSEINHTTVSDHITKTLNDLRTSINSYYSKFKQIDRPLVAQSQLNSLVDTIEIMYTDEHKNAIIVGTAESLANIMGISKDFSAAEKAKFEKLKDLTDLKTKIKSQPIINILKEINDGLVDGSLSQNQKTQLLSSLKSELSKAKTLDEQLLSMIERYLYPNILSIKDTSKSDSFEHRLATKIANSILLGANDTLAANKPTAIGYKTASSDLNDLKTAFEYLIDVDVIDGNLAAFKAIIEQRPAFKFGTINAFITEDEYKILLNIYKNFQLVKQANLIEEAKLFESEKITDWVANIEDFIGILEPSDLKESLSKMSAELEQLLEDSIDVSDENSTTLTTIALENQLLKEILRTDVERDFFYTAKLDANMAIDITNSAEENRTLLNPALNYDINNINNSFVISKLDIDYLDDGIQIARSSRVSY